LVPLNQLFKVAIYFKNICRTVNLFSFAFFRKMRLWWCDCVCPNIGRFLFHCLFKHESVLLRRGQFLSRAATDKRRSIRFIDLFFLLQARPRASESERLTPQETHKRQAHHFAKTRPGSLRTRPGGSVGSSWGDKLPVWSWSRDSIKTWEVDLELNCFESVLSWDDWPWKR